MVQGRPTRMSASEKSTLGLPLRRSGVSPPLGPKILPRPRLLEIFNTNRDKSLILIIGQPAQGKSIAAAQYLNQASEPYIWINLAPEDSDPVHLLHYFSQYATSPLSLMSGRGITSDKPTLYRYWVSSLFKSLTQPLTIVLDGLDLLASEAETFLFVQIFLEEMPPNFRLFLLAREYPPQVLDFQKRKMGRQALLLKNEDLAFAPVEITEYFRKLHDIPLKGEQVPRLYKATEGWIGGITMLSEIFKKMPREALREFLEDKWPISYLLSIFQYFGREVFSHLSTFHQEFLLKSSLFSDLDNETVRSFFPETLGEDLLRTLARKNLFIKGLPDPKRGMVFHYHPLFKIYLGTLFRSRLVREEIKALQIQAGVHYTQLGSPDKAIPHFLESGSYAEAANLIKEIGLTMIRQNRLADLSLWLRELPPSLIESDPWLLLFQTIPNRYLNLMESIELLKKVTTLFREQENPSGLLLALAFLIEAELTLGIYRPDLIEEAETFLKTLPSNTFLYECTHLYVHIGLAHSLRGNPRRGYWACQNAYILSKRLSDPLLQAMALANSVICLTILGELQSAERFLKEMDAISWKSPSTEIRFHHSLSRITFLIVAGQAREALNHCRTLQGEIEEQGLLHLYPLVLLHKQVALLYDYKDAEATLVGQQLEDLAEGLNSGFLKGVTQFLLALSAYRTQKHSRALAIVDRILPLFREGPSQTQLYYWGSRLLRVLLSGRGNPSKTVEEAQEILSYFTSIESHLFQAECHLALGLFLHEDGRENKARDHLQQGFGLIRKREFQHFMLISPADTVRACMLINGAPAASDNTSEPTSWLVFKKFGHQAQEELMRLCGHSNPQVRQKAWEGRRFVHRSQRPVLRIETFGGLRLHLNDQPVDEKVWERSQPRKLLLALLSQENEKAHKELLIEALWPDEEMESGGKNFKTALQRLRKSLEPELSPDFGSSYVHLHQNMVFLDEELCRLDLRQFNELYREGVNKEKSGDHQGALDFFTRSLHLYQGDLLPEEQDAPWVEKRRESIRNTFIDLLTRTAGLYEKNGAFKKAVGCLKQVVEADPLSEENYRTLMSLYDSKKMFNEALRVYEGCRKALKAGLDTRPGPMTEALYQGIKNRLK
jgi:LuxR family transcriptional regulator, maltose regulon positive regulatory protein